MDDHSSSTSFYEVTTNNELEDHHSFVSAISHSMEKQNESHLPPSVSMHSIPRDPPYMSVIEKLKNTTLECSHALEEVSNTRDCLKTMTSQLQEMESQAEWMENMNQKLESEIVLVSKEYSDLMSKATAIQSENDALKTWLTDVSALNLTDQALILSIKELNSEMEAKNARMELESLNSQWESKYMALQDKIQSEGMDLEKSKTLNSILKSELSKAIGIHKDLNSTFSQFRVQVSQKLNEMIVQMTAYHNLYKGLKEERMEMETELKKVKKQRDHLESLAEEKEQALSLHQSKSDEESMALTRELQDMESKYEKVCEEKNNLIKECSSKEESIRTKDKEIHSLKQSSHETDVHLEKIVQENQDFETQLENLQETLELKEEELEGLQDQFKDSQEETRAMTEKWNASMAECEKFKKLYEKSIQECQEKEETILKCQRDVCSKDKILYELKSKVSDWESLAKEREKQVEIEKTSVAKLKESAKDKETQWKSTLQETTKSHQVQIQQFQSKKEEFKAKILDLTRQLQISKEALVQSQEEQELYAQDLQIQSHLMLDKNKEIQTLTDKLHESQESLRQLKESKTFSDIQRLQTEKDVLTEKVKTLESKQEHYLQEIKEFKIAVEGYQDSCEYKDCQNDELRKTQQKLLQQKECLEKEFQEKSKEYQGAIATLQSQLEEVVTLCEVKQQEKAELELKWTKDPNFSLESHILQLSNENSSLKIKLQEQETIQQKWIKECDALQSKLTVSQDSPLVKELQEENQKYVSHMAAWKQELYKILGMFRHVPSTMFESPSLIESIHQILYHLKSLVAMELSMKQEEKDVPFSKNLSHKPINKFKSLASSLKKIQSWKSQSQSQLSQTTLNTNDPHMQSPSEEGRVYEFETEVYRVFHGVLGGRKKLTLQEIQTSSPKAIMDDMIQAIEGLYRQILQLKTEVEQRDAFVKQQALKFKIVEAMYKKSVSS